MEYKLTFHFDNFKEHNFVINSTLKNEKQINELLKNDYVKFTNNKGTNKTFVVNLSQVKLIEIEPIE